MNATMSEIISCSMDNTEKSIFLTIPAEVLVDLLYLLPTSSVINFYLVSSTHLRLFDSEHGFWEQITRKIFKWSTSALPSQNQGANNIVDWKKEYRVSSYFDSSIRDSQIRPVASNTDLSLLKTLSKNHFKAKTTIPRAAGTSYCTLQSDTKLFPLPIGNFTTAYYEVEAVSLQDPDYDLIIGGATKGYSGYVGVGIASYGYWIDGAICLEFALTPVVDPEFKITVGDIVGFGINFVKKSVFFTKNGKLIHEADKNFDDKPLLELMNLHATISMGNHEVKVNMGSAPFEFDLLKYQQEHTQRPLELYSNIVVKHLLSAVEMSTEQVLGGTSYFVIDNNVPDFDFYLPDMFYVIIYGRLPPNSKYFKNNDDTNQMLTEMRMLSMTLNSAKIMLNMTSKQSPAAEGLIADMIQAFQIESVRSKPWEEQVTTVLDCANQTYCEILIHCLLSDCLDEIAEFAFARSRMAAWATDLLAAVEFLRNDRPGGMDHWTKECMATVFNPNNAPLNDVVSKIVTSRTLAAMSVLTQRCRHLADVKTEEQDLMMTVFGSGDDKLVKGYDELIDNLLLRGDADPFMYAHVKDDDMNRISAQIAARLVIDEDKNANPSNVILYGIYHLKISPNDFKSMEEYVREVFKQNEKLITDNLKQRHLLNMWEFLRLLSLEDEGGDIDDIYNVVTMPLKAMYGVEVQMDGDIEEIAARANKEIDRMFETKNYGPANSRRKTVANSNATSSSLLIVGTVAAIGVIGLGAWWLRKRFAK